MPSIGNELVSWRGGARAGRLLRADVSAHAPRLQDGKGNKDEDDHKHAHPLKAKYTEARVWVQGPKSEVGVQRR